MDDLLKREVSVLKRAILEGIGSEIALLNAISRGMNKALATRKWEYVEVTRQTVEEVIQGLTRVRDEAS